MTPAWPGTSSPAGMMPPGMVIPLGGNSTSGPRGSGAIGSGVSGRPGPRNICVEPLDGRSVAFASLREDGSASIDVYDILDGDRWSRKRPGSTWVTSSPASIA